MPILVGGGGERTSPRYAAHYAEASNLGPASRAAGAFRPDEAARKFAVLDGHLAEAGRPANVVPRTGLLAAFLSSDPAGAAATRAGLPPRLDALFEQLPFVESVKELMGQVRAMFGVGIRYAIFVVMLGHEETLGVLADRVFPAVAWPGVPFGPVAVATQGGGLFGVWRAAASSW